MAYISLEHVVKRYKMGEVTITAVDDITFDIEKGEFVIIVGPSGAGKTTVLNILGGMDACDEGTILVDGKAVKACILSTKRAAGKEIVTVEGLSEAEREAFVYAFGAVGAVQCGFCIPGMVIAGKALLDQNPTPTEAEIKKAIRGNVCRCTGYKKIIEGIALAGAILYLRVYFLGMVPNVIYLSLIHI